LSVYSERLAKLKKDIVSIKDKQKKKPFKPNQIIMIDFINGVTKNAVMNIDGISIIINKGDEKKGFKHILLSHYCNGCPGELTARDILNIDMIIQKGIRLNEVGVTNSDLIVYRYLKGLNEFKVVLKPVDDNQNFVVTFYSRQ
jgi:hypothetical protein